jgi:hypothetical protein
VRGHFAHEHCPPCACACVHSSDPSYLRAPAATCYTCDSRFRGQTSGISERRTSRSPDDLLLTLAGDACLLACAPGPTLQWAALVDSPLLCLDCRARAASGRLISLRTRKCSGEASCARLLVPPSQIIVFAGTRAGQVDGLARVRQVSRSRAHHLAKLLRRSLAMLTAHSLGFVLIAVQVSGHSSVRCERRDLRSALALSCTVRKQHLARRAQRSHAILAAHSPNVAGGIACVSGISSVPFVCVRLEKNASVGCHRTCCVQVGATRIRTWSSRHKSNEVVPFSRKDPRMCLPVL